MVLGVDAGRQGDAGEMIVLFQGYSIYQFDSINSRDTDT